ncbi:unnamed protein product [Peniophora sp. CBMAI 1063]|nr:unnamed protein product [Peniophora sp. CBMAI 1063]
MARWRNPILLFTQLLPICATVDLNAVLALMVALAVAQTRADLFLIASFLLTCNILFNPRQPPRAASATNTATAAVPESPLDVELLLNSSMDAEGDLKSVTGVVTGNLAAPPTVDDRCNPYHEYDWFNDPNNIQCNDFKRFYSLMSKPPRAAHSVTARRRYNPVPPSPTSFTPHRVATLLPSPPKPDRTTHGDWHEQDQQECKPSRRTPINTNGYTGTSAPITERPLERTIQQVQDDYYLHNPDALSREADANLFRRVRKRISDDFMCNIRHRLALWLQPCFPSTGPRGHEPSFSPATTWCRDTDDMMDTDAVESGIARSYELTDQDMEEPSAASVFCQTSATFSSTSPVAADQHPSAPRNLSALTHATGIQSDLDPTPAFAPKLAPSPTPSSSDATFRIAGQPVTFSQSSQSIRSPTSTQQPHSSPSSLESNAQEQQHQREEALQTSRTQHFYSQQEVQEHQTTMDAERRRREELKRSASTPEDTDEQRKKEEAAKQRAKVSARIRSIPRTPPSAPSTPKPAKKVNFVDDVALPPGSSGRLVSSPTLGQSAFNTTSAVQTFLADIAKSLGTVEFENPSTQLPDAEEGEETEVDEYAQAKAVKQAQGELDEPEGFDEMVENIQAARRKKAADFF